MNIEKTYEKFERLMKRINNLESIEGKLEWDKFTYIPPKGAEILAKQTGLIQGIRHEILTSNEMSKYLEELESNYDEMNQIQKANFREMKRTYERNVKVPKDLIEELSEAKSRGYSIWVKAKESSDFSVFEPQLKKFVELQIKYADYIDSEKNPYLVLIEENEPGVGTLDKLIGNFENLKRSTIPLIKSIQDSNVDINRNLYKKSYSKKKQMKFSRYISEKIGYDYNRGRIDESIHPFTVGFGPSDVRITTFFSEKNPLKSIFSTIHESGHGIYSQGLPEKYLFENIGSYRSLGFHESQSRFYENNIGRSKEFWEFFFPQAKKIFPSQLREYSVDDFYKVVNEVKPGLIRIDADELTYNFHIILRTEIENDLINGRIEVSDLPKIWNDNMERYLGIEPKKDSDGVLQDVHWSCMEMGYFPTYTIGNILASQIQAKMKKSIKNIDEKIRNGEFNCIKDWLNKNIHEKGCLYNTQYLVKKVTGSDLDTSHHIKYLTKKFSELYCL